VADARDAGRPVDRRDPLAVVAAPLTLAAASLDRPARTPGEPVPFPRIATHHDDRERSMPRTTLRLCSAALVAVLVVACGKQESAAPAATGSADASARVYSVGTDAAYAPFESQNEKGEIVGFDVDVVRAVAAKAGIEVKFVNTPWEGIFNALKQGDRDLLASSITITDERKLSMDFSEPYFDAHQLIAVKADSKVARFDDLKSLKIGVQTGTTGDETVSKLQGKNSADIKRFESTPLALKELEAGGIDAVVADNGVVVNYVKNNAGSKFKTVDDSSFVPEHYGIAVRKGDADLLGKLNRGLAAIRADGTYDRIYAGYLGAPAVASAAAPPASK
jgi:polar amino acid transport system substrate-binding protein